MSMLMLFLVAMVIVRFDPLETAANLLEAVGAAWKIEVGIILPPWEERMLEEKDILVLPAVRGAIAEVMVWREACWAILLWATGFLMPETVEVKVKSAMLLCI